MAERDGQGHDDVCAHASGNVCLCACRGRFHGVASSARGGSSRLARMADVAVQGRTDTMPAKPAGKAETPAQRRANPVHVGGATPAPTPTPGGIQNVDTGGTISRGEAARRMYGTGPLWMRRGTNRPVRNPTQTDLVRGEVVRDKRREDARDAAIAKADEIDAKLARMAEVQVTGRDGTQRRTVVPADLALLTDDELASLMIDHPDEAERIGAELDERDRVAAYRQLVESVPDSAAGLERLDEGTLMDLYARITATERPDAVATARLEVELDRRTQVQNSARAELNRYMTRDVQGLTEADLDVAARHATTAGDSAALDRIYGEWDRRRKAAETERARQAARDSPDDAWLYGTDAEDWSTQWRDDEGTTEDRRVSELVAQGYDWLEAYAQVHGQNVDDLRRQEELDAVRGTSTGRTREILRRQYDEYTALRYLEAEQATAGHLLNARGRQAAAEGRLDPLELFSGPQHVVDAYASEELQRWWGGTGRITFADFTEQMLGGAGANQRRRLERSAGRQYA